MPDIIHRIGTTEPIAKVFSTLTTVDGLAGWWTSTTSGDPTVGGTLTFAFKPATFRMKVLDVRPNEQVSWQVQEGPADWIGTKLHFELKRDGAHTILLFRHQGWAEAGESMAHCSTKWAIFLMSLKALVETGRGTPEPHDPKIDNWN